MISLWIAVPAMATTLLLGLAIGACLAKRYFTAAMVTIDSYDCTKREVTVNVPAHALKIWAELIDDAAGSASHPDDPSGNATEVNATPPTQVIPMNPPVGVGGPAVLVCVWAAVREKHDNASFPCDGRAPGAAKYAQARRAKRKGLWAKCCLP